MSAHKIIPDLEHVASVTKKNVEMLITMHTGLAEIAKVPASLDGGVAMRYIAQKTLTRVNEIAATMEVVNA